MNKYLLPFLLFLSASFMNQGGVLASQDSLQEKRPSDPLEKVYRHITHPSIFEDELNGYLGSLFTTLEMASKFGYLRSLSPSLEMISKLSKEILPHFMKNNNIIVSNQKKSQTINQNFLTTHSALVTLLSINPFTDDKNSQQWQQLIDGLICVALDDLILKYQPGYENQKQSYLAIDQFNDALEQAKAQLNKQDEKYIESLIWNYNLVRGVLETLLDCQIKGIEVEANNDEEVKLPQTDKEWMDVLIDKFEIPSDKLKALLSQEGLSLSGQNSLIEKSKRILDKAIGLLVSDQSGLLEKSNGIIDKSRELLMDSEFKEIPDDVKKYIMSYRIDESYNKKVLGGKEKEPIINKNIYQQMVGASRESRKVWRVIENKEDLNDYLENVENNGILKSVSWVKFVFTPTPEQIKAFVKKNKQIKGIEIENYEDLSSNALEPLKELPNLEVLKLNLIISLEDNASHAQSLFNSVTQCSKLKELHLGRFSITSIDDLKNLPDLEELDLAFCRQITDFSALSTLKKLKKLSLRKTFITSIDDLKNLPDLEELDLENCRQITDFSALSDLKKLKRLSLGYTLITSIDDLKNLPDLEELNLESCSKITDFSALSTLKKLKRLSLEDTSITSIDVLKGLFNLEELDLAHCSKITDFSALSTLKKLKKVNFLCTKITSLKDLKNLPDLEELNLESCSKITDFSALSTLKKLKRLSLGYTLITFLKDLKDLTDLEMLNLDDCNKISDISALSTLKKLKRLNLGHTSITFLKDLKDLTDLEILNLDDCNKISDISALSTLKKLKEVILRATSITSLEALYDLPNLKSLNIYGCRRLKPQEITELRRRKPDLLIDIARAF